MYLQGPQLFIPLNGHGTRYFVVKYVNVVSKFPLIDYPGW
jgi:hypothetical protein